MARLARWSCACLALWMVGASAETASPYNTQLFNLVLNQKSPADGKNHYQKQFDTAFDGLLAQSKLAKAASNGVPLKKRLLSGPQPEGVPLQEKGSGQHYLYYESCQAHACSDTSLAVLYAPASNAMLGRLHLDGKDEYLGNPTAAEKFLLDHPDVKAAADPLDTIIGALADNKSFRMTSSQFDAVVAPYCKKTRSDADAYDNRVTYSCDKHSGITEVKIDERKSAKPLGNYMLYAFMSISGNRYAALKTRLDKQLGRASKSGKDYATWYYKGDRQLNAVGYPNFRVSYEGPGEGSTFSFGVESGD